jgi:hypothetical protein
VGFTKKAFSFLKDLLLSLSLWPNWFHPVKNNPAAKASGGMKIVWWILHHHHHML